MPVFVDEKDAAVCAEALRAAALEAGVKVHGYSMSPFEWRVLCTPALEGALARMMQAVGRRYVRHFNNRYSQHGSPWAGRFRSTVLEESTHLLLGLRMAEGVPNVGWLDQAGRAGVVRSSAEHHLGLRADPLINEHGVFWALGNTPFEREVAYRRWIESPVPAPVAAAFLAAAAKGWAVGGPAFMREVEAMSGRRTQPKPRGRPPGKGNRLADMQR